MAGFSVEEEGFWCALSFEFSHSLWDDEKAMKEEKAGGFKQLLGE